MYNVPRPDVPRGYAYATFDNAHLDVGSTPSVVKRKRASSTTSHLPPRPTFDTFFALTSSVWPSGSSYTGPATIDDDKSFVTVKSPHCWPARGEENTLKFSWPSGWLWLT